MAILLEIPKNQWPSLRDLYRNNWPNNAVAFCLLDTKLSYPELRETYNCKIYCPDGDLSSGMVVLDKDGCTLMIHPVNSINKIEEALATTKVVDWNKGITVASASREVEQCLDRIKPSGIIIKGEKAFKHILNRNSVPFEIFCAPPNTYAAQLKPEHIKLIDETWTYHSKASYKFFDLLMRNKLTYVLYSQEDQPLAWVTIDTDGALTHLYCIDEHRRKGYAEFILKIAINDQLEKGKDVLAYTLENNFKAQNLFNKLNFVIFGCDKWLIIDKA